MCVCLCALALVFFLRRPNLFAICNNTFSKCLCGRIYVWLVQHVRENENLAKYFRQKISLRGKVMSKCIPEKKVMKISSVNEINRLKWLEQTRRMK
jgi:hypothetical protein